MRHVKSEALLILVLIIVGMFAVGAYFVYRATHIPLLPWLSEEIGSKPVLAQLSFDTLEPGTVLIVNGTEKGWTIAEKNTQLYDKLELTNIDLNINDVIAPSIYEWFTSSGDDYLVFDFNDVTVNNGVYSLIASGKIKDDYPWDQQDGTPYYTKITGYNSTASAITYAFIGYTSNGLVTVVHRSPNAYRNFITNVSAEWYAISYDGANIHAYYETTEYSTYAWSEGWDQFRDLRIGGDGSVNGFINNFFGRIRFAVAYFGETYIMQKLGVLDQKPNVLVDATFYNGTTWIDLVTGTPATIYGHPIRIPAEHPFLWLVKSLKSDNKVHFMYFPEGTIIRIKDGYGNVVREFKIQGEKAGNTTQVLDYAISLDSTTIPSASIEAWIPSNKIRVYAPLGAEVRVVDENNVTVGSGVVSGSNYVDIALAGPVNNAVIEVVAPNGEDENVVVETKQLDDGSIRIKVMDDNGVLLPGMLVRVADPSNYIVYANVTGQDGTVTFKPSRPLPEATIEVSGIWSGRLVYTTKTVTLAATVTSAAATENNSKYELLALGIGILVIAGLIVAVTRR